MPPWPPSCDTRCLKFFPLISGRRNLDEPFGVSNDWKRGQFRGFLIALTVGAVLAAVVLLFVFRAM